MGLSSGLSPFKTLLPFFKANRWSLLIGLVSLLLVDLLQLLIPLVLKRAIDLLTIGDASSYTLLSLAALILAIATAIALCRYMWRRMIFGHSRKVEEALRNKLFSHLQSLPGSFFQRYKTGDLMARAINDINAIRMATGMGLVGLTDGIILGLAAIGFMVSIDLKLALIALIPAPVVILLTRTLTRRMAAGFEDVQRQFSDLTERVREGLAGIWVIKAFGRENWQYNRVKAEGQKYVEHNLKLARTLSLFFPMMAIFTNAGLVIVIWLGGRLTIFGQITTGDFVAFTSYLNLLTWPMMALGWVTNLIQRASASIKRINAILDEKPEITSTDSPMRPCHIRGEIRLSRLTYRYPGQKHPALRNVSLTIKAGETVAIVGRVGCGKTTLLSALVRMINIRPETLFIDNQEVHRIPLQILRQAIGFVPQQTLLFSDSIRNNIVLGRNHITHEQIERALDTALITEEIEKLPKGIDTIIGERGATLSGGQRQRIALARAIVGDPRILVLDDALSMVDIQTEGEILRKLLHLREGKTNIIVSHRTSTLARVDRIAVMDKGKIIDVGPHDFLIESCQLYRQLYEGSKYSEELEAI